MKQAILSLVLFLVLISFVSAEQLLCRYQEGFSMVVNKSKMYQCPPVVKKFYRLESQEELIPATQGGGGGSTWYAGGGGGTVDIEKPKQEDAAPKDMMFRWTLVLFSFIVVICLFIAVVVLIIIQYVKDTISYIKRKAKRRKK